MHRLILLAALEMHAASLRNQEMDAFTLLQATAMYNSHMLTKNALRHSFARQDAASIMMEHAQAWLQALFALQKAVFLAREQAVMQYLCVEKSAARLETIISWPRNSNAQRCLSYFLH